MPSSPCFATTAATAVAAAAALSDTTGNFQLLEVLFLIYFHYISCIFMLYHEDHLVIQSPDPSLHSAFYSL